MGVMKVLAECTWRFTLFGIAREVTDAMSAAGGVTADAMSAAGGVTADAMSAVLFSPS